MVPPVPESLPFILTNAPVHPGLFGCPSGGNAHSSRPGLSRRSSVACLIRGRYRLAGKSGAAESLQPPTNPYRIKTLVEKDPLDEGLKSDALNQ
jgi:hypothetical protein